MKKRSILIFILFTVIAFLSGTLLTILVYQVFPEKGRLIWLISPGLGAVFGLLVFPAFKNSVEKQRS